MQSERKVLVSALLKAENSGYSNIVLREILNKTDLNDLSKGFVTTVFYGVLERKYTLDAILNKFLKKPIEKAPPFTKAVLRSGAYQIFFMDKVPNSAAVNESVKIIKKSKEQGNSGLVNAVLRKLCDLEIEECINNLSKPLKYSVEEWIYNALVTDYSKEQAESFLENSLEPPPIFLRINTLKENAKERVVKEVTKLGGEVYETDFADLLKTKGIKSPERLESYRQGLFFVQDYSSRFCAECLAVKEGMRVLDCCAAPGGKTFSTAINMRNTGEIFALDIHPHRVDLISQGAERLGLTNIKTLPLDAGVYCDKLGEFDRVLCDVPCSGIGVIRRKPEIKYKSNEECLALLPLQKNILKTAAKYVKSGGRLIYSTCTLLKRENRDIVEGFLKENPGFTFANNDRESALKTFIPPESSGDGFFVAVLERL